MPKGKCDLNLGQRVIVDATDLWFDYKFFEDEQYTICCNFNCNLQLHVLTWRAFRWFEVENFTFFFIDNVAGFIWLRLCSSDKRNQFSLLNFLVVLVTKYIFAHSYLHLLRFSVKDVWTLKVVTGLVSTLANEVTA